MPTRADLMIQHGLLTATITAVKGQFNPQTVSNVDRQTGRVEYRRAVVGRALSLIISDTGPLHETWAKPRARLTVSFDKPNAMERHLNDVLPDDSCARKGEIPYWRVRPLKAGETPRRLERFDALLTEMPLLAKLLSTKPNEAWLSPTDMHALVSQYYLYENRRP